MDEFIFAQTKTNKSQKLILNLTFYNSTFFFLHQRYVKSHRNKQHPT